MIELSPATRQRVTALFPDEQVAEAARLLAEACAETLSLGRNATPSSLERIRFAAIRLSGGNLARLREALRLARIDWRDLLMAADFGMDVHAHEIWVPRRFDARVVDEWSSGQRPSGVEFSRGEPVRVVTGSWRGREGTVRALLALEPEPRYRVDIGAGKKVEVPQGSLVRP